MGKSKTTTIGFYSVILAAIFAFTYQQSETGNIRSIVSGENTRNTEVQNHTRSFNQSNAIDALQSILSSVGEGDFSALSDFPENTHLRFQIAPGTNHHSGDISFWNNGDNWEVSISETLTESIVQIVNDPNTEIMQVRLRHFSDGIPFEHASLNFEAKGYETIFLDFPTSWGTIEESRISFQTGSIVEAISPFTYLGDNALPISVKKGYRFFIDSYGQTYLLADNGEIIGDPITLNETQYNPENTLLDGIFTHARGLINTEEVTGQIREIVAGMGFTAEQSDTTDWSGLSTE